MFECQICGLLSLGGTACPACGSQLRTDLSTAIESVEHLPNEVPGLDDAAAAWYDLEGIEPPEEAAEPPHDSQPPSEEGSLPFGFQGQSNVYASRLPFGIGSFAEGIPFDAGSAPPPAPITPDSHRVEPVMETTPSPSMTPPEPAPPAVDAVRAVRARAATMATKTEVRVVVLRAKRARCRATSPRGKPSTAHARAMPSSPTRIRSPSHRV